MDLKKKRAELEAQKRKNLEELQAVEARRKQLVANLQALGGALELLDEFEREEKP